MNFEAVIFDLDGTLLDTLADLADSMNSALRGLGYPEHDPEKYRYFVGDGMRNLARRVLPVDGQDENLVETVVKAMTTEYEQGWDVKTKPYSGMEDTLDQLVAAGLKLAVLSNKPDPFTKKMVAALLPRWQFQPVLGARPDAPLKPDPAVALEIAQMLKIDPAKFLYVGDTATDMRTANAAGMFAVGAAWGFRTVEELEQSGARRIVHRPAEIVELL
jgi:phosphoglycolate phosphatase